MPPVILCRRYRALCAGEIFSYTIMQVGSWGYHNHLNATQEGTIIVEE